MWREGGQSGEATNRWVAGREIEATTVWGDLWKEAQTSQQKHDAFYKGQTMPVNVHSEDGRVQSVLLTASQLVGATRAQLCGHRSSCASSQLVFCGDELDDGLCWGEAWEKSGMKEDCSIALTGMNEIEQPVWDLNDDPEQLLFLSLETSSAAEDLAKAAAEAEAGEDQPSILTENALTSQRTRALPNAQATAADFHQQQAKAAAVQGEADVDLQSALGENASVLMVHAHPPIEEHPVEMADDGMGHNTPVGHNERAEHTENPSELGKGQTAGDVSAAQGGSQLWHRRVLVQEEEKGRTTEQP